MIGMSDTSPFDGTWDRGLLPPNVSVGARCWIERFDSFAP